jgi:hypothetical protein
MQITSSRYISGERPTFQLARKNLQSAHSQTPILFGILLNRHSAGLERSGYVSPAAVQPDWSSHSSGASIGFSCYVAGGVMDSVVEKWALVTAASSGFGTISV